MSESAVRIVPESELTPEQLAYAQGRGLLRQAHESYAGGNRMTLEQMERLVNEGKAQKAAADAYTAQKKREQAEAQAEAAREKAAQDRAERVAAEAALKEEIWSTYQYSRELFEAQYDTLLLDHIRKQQNSQESYRDRKRREMSGL